ncbi:MAG: OmpA family protein [Deltaproteobacteria bacterium]|jgi:chemotaxis protein MotB|nr:OmpA family protein [Deltaproteobacteria bacterium]
MSADKKNQPIIKKIIKKGHGGHHGGSWKVAYADFVTAMMAFFLVMWLLAISSESGKAALADYYNNLTMTDALFNGGMPAAFDPSADNPGILEGGCFQLTRMGEELEEREKALEAREKALNEGAGDSAQLVSTIATPVPQNPDLSSLPEGQEGGEGSTETGIAPGQGLENVGTAPGSGPGYQPAAVIPGMGSGTAEQALQAKNRLASDLTASVAASLGGEGGLEGQFSVEFVPGGLRIELMDKEGRPMFVSGQPRLTPLAQLILTSVAERLVTIPNKLAIEGHTDAVATTSQELTNWELSTARASAARRFLARHGVTDDRLTMVAGYSSTQPIAGANPTDPVNRRVAIMIWDEPPQPDQISPTGPPAAPGAPAPPAPPTTSAPPTQSTPPPSAGNVSTPEPVRPVPPPRRPATPPSRPSQEALEQMLLEETLKRAATPDTGSLPSTPDSPSNRND